MGAWGSKHTVKESKEIEPVQAMTKTPIGGYVLVCVHTGDNSKKKNT